MLTENSTKESRKFVWHPPRKRKKGRFIYFFKQGQSDEGPLLYKCVRVFLQPVRPSRDSSSVSARPPWPRWSCWPRAASSSFSWRGGQTSSSTVSTGRPLWDRPRRSCWRTSLTRSSRRMWCWGRARGGTSATRRSSTFGRATGSASWGTWTSRCVKATFTSTRPKDWDIWPSRIGFKSTGRTWSRSACLPSSIYSSTRPWTLSTCFKPTRSSCGPFRCTGSSPWSSRWRRWCRSRRAFGRRGSRIAI